MLSLFSLFFSLCASRQKYRPNHQSIDKICSINPVCKHSTLFPSNHCARIANYRKKMFHPVVVANRSPFFQNFIRNHIHAGKDDTKKLSLSIDSIETSPQLETHRRSKSILKNKSEASRLLSDPESERLLADNMSGSGVSDNGANMVNLIFECRLNEHILLFRLLFCYWKQNPLCLTVCHFLR